MWYLTYVVEFLFFISPDLSLLPCWSVRLVKLSEAIKIRSSEGLHWLCDKQLLWLNLRGKIKCVCGSCLHIFINMYFTWKCSEIHRNTTYCSWCLYYMFEYNLPYFFFYICFYNFLIKWNFRVDAVHYQTSWAERSMIRLKYHKSEIRVVKNLILKGLILHRCLQCYILIEGPITRT